MPRIPRRVTSDSLRLAPISTLATYHDLDCRVDAIDVGRGIGFCYSETLGLGNCFVEALARLHFFEDDSRGGVHHTAKSNNVDRRQGRAKEREYGSAVHHGGLEEKAPAPGTPPIGSIRDK